VRRLPPLRACEVASGVFAVPTPGTHTHTPGRTAWRIASGNEQPLIWGDVTHLPGIQFAIPEASVVYDVDSSAAAAAGRRVLKMVSADRIPVAGVRLDSPATASRRRSGTVAVPTSGALEAGDMTIRRADAGKRQGELAAARTKPAPVAGSGLPRESGSLSNRRRARH
jgi:hypothetical protein